MCPICGSATAAAPTCSVCGAQLPDAGETRLDSTIYAPDAAGQWAPSPAVPGPVAPPVWTPQQPAPPVAPAWGQQPVPGWAPQQGAPASGQWAAASYGQPSQPPAPMAAPPPPPRGRSSWPLILIAGVLTVALLGVAGVLTGVLPSPLATPASPTPRPMTTVTVTSQAPGASSVPAPATTVAGPPATVLGAWTATCSSVDADAAALAANLAGAPGFAVPQPSTVSGFPQAAQSAVKPLYGCPVAHSLKVRDKVAVASDPAATTIVKAAVDALLRTVVLSLGATKIGRFNLGSVGIDEARPIYVAVLGKPDRVEDGSCSLSGQKWTDLVWGGFTISFDAGKSGKPLHSWALNTTSSYPGNVTLFDSLPLSATLSELRAFNSSISASSMWANGVPPYVAAVRPGLVYVWEGPTDQKSSVVMGGPGHPCE